jgi:hypothetical protein
MAMTTSSSIRVNAVFCLEFFNTTSQGAADGRCSIGLPCWSD